jgi:EAL domain-containing protein (putative c-di-GMP-specific phosphodiesterase class I)
MARGVLDGLRAMGLTVSLDDFGTGYSSLYHLRELPFDKVKIDKSFMRALATDAESARYVGAIIGLCHALGLEMTAEGIEDEPTLRRLRELGCTYGQGYLFGKAVPAAEASQVLTSNGWPALAAE